MEFAASAPPPRSSPVPTNNPVRLAYTGLAELWSRRVLVWYLVRAHIHRVGADTVLGNLWWLLDPLLLMLVYSFLVGVVFQRGGPEYPLFILAALLPWQWFASAVSDATSAVTSRERLVHQLLFPKIVLPAATTFGAVGHFAFGLVALAGIMVAFFDHRITVWLLLIPAVAIVQLVFTFAVALLVAALTVFYRDIGNITRHGLRFWFYLSPALWGAERIPELRERLPWPADAVQWNPFFTLLTAYRELIFYGGPPDWKALLILLNVSILGLVVAIAVFKRLEPAFAKVL